MTHCAAFLAFLLQGAGKMFSPITEYSFTEISVHQMRTINKHVGPESLWARTE